MIICYFSNWVSFSWNFKDGSICLNVLEHKWSPIYGKEEIIKLTMQIFLITARSEFVL
jgi:ubiquitin-protein ligase